MTEDQLRHELKARIEALQSRGADLHELRARHDSQSKTIAKLYAEKDDLERRLDAAHKALGRAVAEEYLKNGD